MRTRLISAAVLVPVVFVPLFLGQPFLQLGIAALAGLAGYETAGLVTRAGLPANRWLAAIAPIAAVMGFSYAILPIGFGPWYSDGWWFLAPAVGLWVIATAVFALRVSEPALAFKTWLGTLFAGLLSSMLAFAAGISLLRFGDSSFTIQGRQHEYGELWLLILLLTVWSLDSAAYVVGRALPRGHFMNHISPKKTWSGAIGGTLVAVLVSIILASVVFLSADPVIAAVTGLLIALAAQSGDLAESMLKRAAGAKDSGTLIPGHGGILDRVDSFLFAAPVVYTWLLALTITGKSIF